jgi:hypothetical protein
MKSIVSYPDRGKWGNARYRGNCSGHLIADLVREFKPQRLVDPMLGGGTSQDVCQDLGTPFWGSDLRDGFDATQDDIPIAFDFGFLHPAYHNIVRYSGNMWGTQPDPRDLSQCATYEEFLDKLDAVQFRIYDALRGGGLLAVLIGDVRKSGVLYPLSRDMRWYGEPVSQIIKVQHNVTSARTQYSGRFIELAHEYLVLTRKPKGWAIPVRVTQATEIDLVAQSWRNVVQTALEVLGEGAHSLADIYHTINDHPRVKESGRKGQDWQAKVRQTLQMYSRVFRTAGRGQWQLAKVGA